MIKITNSYIDRLEIDNVLKDVLKKEFSAKTSYWLANIFNEIQELSKIYLAERQKLIERYAKRNEKNEIITDGMNVSIKDVNEFSQKLKDLLDIEIDLKTKKIVFDLDIEPKCSVDEMFILLPLVEVENAGD